jgi:hypothetical protein
MKFSYVLLVILLLALPIFFAVPETEATAIDSLTDISDLELYFRADDINNISCGATVGQWDDQSGNSRHASPFGTPTLACDELNGRDVVDFDLASSEYFSIPDFNYGDDNEVTVIVVHKSEGSGIRAMASHTNFLSDQRWGIYTTPNDLVSLVTSETGSNDKEYQLGTTVQDRYSISVLRFDEGDLTGKINSLNEGLSKVYDSSTTNLYDTNVPILIGAWHSVGTPIQFFDGKIALFAMYGRALLDSELENIEELLGKYYKINTRHPSDLPDVVMWLNPEQGNDFFSLNTDPVPYWPNWKDEGATLSPELHTISDAAASAEGTEGNNVTQWTCTALSVCASQSGTVQLGTYAAEFSDNVSPTPGARVYFDLENTFNLVDGEFYELKFWVRHVGTGGNWLCALSGSSTGFPAPDYVYLIQYDAIINTADTTWTEQIATFKHGDHSEFLLCYEWNAPGDGGIYLDNLSVKQGISAGVRPPISAQTPQLVYPGQNSRPVIRFDSIDDNLVADTFPALLDHVTVIAAFEIDADTTWGGIVTGGYEAASFRYLPLYHDPNEYIYSVAYNDLGNCTIATDLGNVNTGAAVTTWQVFSNTIDQNIEAEQRQAGSIGGTNNPRIWSSPPCPVITSYMGFEIASYDGRAENPIETGMDFGDVVVIINDDAGAVDSDRCFVEEYLADKYALSYTRERCGGELNIGKLFDGWLRDEKVLTA